MHDRNLTLADRTLSSDAISAILTMILIQLMKILKIQATF